MANKLFLTVIFSMLSLLSISQNAPLTLINSNRGKIVKIEKFTHLVIKKNSGDKIRGRFISLQDSTITIEENFDKTSKITISEIQLIKKDLFNNRKWLEPFGYIGIGAGLGLIATPFIWIFEGSKKAWEGLKFAGILASVSLPVILLGTSKNRYNLNNNWRIAID
ncbi:hypothetical protein [Luteirhabdus pelagi]|uniref:hypothetical protein n=1 Tax=Luteirhabdus pelagi TaxID=2792783 RepID=UPI0019399A69|nr:hypothetical protein [Luteirhabdus pelagi]